MSASGLAPRRRYWLAVKLNSAEIHPLFDEHDNLDHAQRAAKRRARTFCSTGDGEERRDGANPVDTDVLRKDAVSIVIMFDARTAPVREFPIHRPSPFRVWLLSNGGKELGRYTRIAGYASLLGLWSPAILVVTLKYWNIQPPDAVVVALVLIGLSVFVICLPMLLFLSIRYRQRLSFSAALAMALGASPVFFFFYIVVELGHHGMF